MKIYTRTGDAGTTGLGGGGRVAKHDPRIDAYGTLDEFNAALGVARAEPLSPEVDSALALMQHDLFALGAELASPAGPAAGMKPVAAESVARLERTIDELEARLPALRHFILPGGARGAAALHAARCVCRRAERELTALAAQAPVRDVVLQYVNRASDLLFVAARRCNQAAGVGDVPWEKS